MLGPPTALILRTASDPFRELIDGACPMEPVRDGDCPLRAVRGDDRWGERVRLGYQTASFNPAAGESTNGHYRPDDRTRDRPKYHCRHTAGQPRNELADTVKQ
jgi:hypothetical protein